MHTHMFNSHTHTTYVYFTQTYTQMEKDTYEVCLGEVQPLLISREWIV